MGTLTPWFYTQPSNQSHDPSGTLAIAWESSGGASTIWQTDCLEKLQSQRSPARRSSKAAITRSLQHHLTPYRHMHEYACNDAMLFPKCDLTCRLVSVIHMNFERGSVQNCVFSPNIPTWTACLHSHCVIRALSEWMKGKIRKKQEKFLLQNSGQVPEWASQGGG